MVAQVEIIMQAKDQGIPEPARESTDCPRPSIRLLFRIKPKKITTMSEINSLKDLLVEEIKDLYSAENQLLKALPKMAAAATNEELKAGFTEHLEQTRNHVTRLEQAGELLGESPSGKTCKAMEGLIEEGTEAIESDAPDAVSPTFPCSQPAAPSQLRPRAELNA